MPTRPKLQQLAILLFPRHSSADRKVESRQAGGQKHHPSKKQDTAKESALTNPDVAGHYWNLARALCCLVHCSDCRSSQNALL
jgi:hypothetical protein